MTGGIAVATRVSPGRPCAAANELGDVVTAVDAAAAAEGAASGGRGHSQKAVPPSAIVAVSARPRGTCKRLRGHVARVFLARTISVERVASLGVSVAAVVD